MNEFDIILRIGIEKFQLYNFTKTCAFLTDCWLIIDLNSISVAGFCTRMNIYISHEVQPDRDGNAHFRQGVLNSIKRNN